MYCWVKDNTIALYLTPETAFSISPAGDVSLVPFLGTGGVNYPPRWLLSVGPEWAANYGILPLEVVGNSTQDNFHLTSFVDSVIAGKPTRTYSRTPKPLADCKAHLTDKVLELRWQKRTGGFVWNGSTIKTDDVSLNSMTGAVALFDKDPTLTSVEWDVGGGNFVSLDKNAMQALAVAAGRWVQAVYSASKTILTNVAALQTVEACASFDITVGWP